MQMFTVLNKKMQRKKCMLEHNNIVYFEEHLKSFCFGQEHCGWLRKLGGRYRNLRSRWFELKGDQLYYFRDNNVSKHKTIYFLDSLPHKSTVQKGRAE